MRLCRLMTMPMALALLALALLALALLTFSCRTVRRVEGNREQKQQLEVQQLARSDTISRWNSTNHERIVVQWWGDSLAMTHKLPLPALSEMPALPQPPSGGYMIAIHQEAVTEQAEQQQTTQQEVTELAHNYLVSEKDKSTRSTYLGGSLGLLLTLLCIMMAVGWKLKTLLTNYKKL